MQHMSRREPQPGVPMAKRQPGHGARIIGRRTALNSAALSHPARMEEPENDALTARAVSD